jgi:hypothetical protein
MVELFIGLGILILAVHPKTKLYPGRLTGRQKQPPGDSGFVGRILFVLVGVAVTVDGLLSVFRGR